MGLSMIGQLHQGEPHPWGMAAEILFAALRCQSHTHSHASTGLAATETTAEIQSPPTNGRNSSFLHKTYPTGTATGKAAHLVAMASPSNKEHRITCPPPSALRATRKVAS